MSDTPTAKDKTTDDAESGLGGASGSADVGSWSLRGRRARNEDAHVALTDLSIYIIADGMGGHSNGDEASQEAVDTARAFLEAAEKPAEVLADAVQAAHRAVSEHLDNRGTTLTIAAVGNGELRIAHVGDTRVYVDGEQVTRDQGIGYVLEEFVGGGDDPKIQTHRRSLAGRSWLLMSTDGIHDVLPIGYLFGPMAKVSQQDPTQLARYLAMTAFQAGSMDNCTAIVVRLP